MKNFGVSLTKSEMKKILGGKEQCYECSTPVDPTVGTFYCNGIEDCLSKLQQTCAGAPGDCTCNVA